MLLLRLVECCLVAGLVSLPNPARQPAPADGRPRAVVRVVPTPPPEPSRPFGQAPRLLFEWGSYGEGPGQFIYIADVAVDDFGNVYVLDENRSLIRKYSSDGSLLGQWGGRGSRPGELQNPVNLAVGGGRVFVSDYYSNCVHVFTDEGRFLQRWGQTGSAPGQLHEPQGLAVDRAGHVYVVDRGNHRIEKFTADGRFLLEWGRQGRDPGEFLEPVGVAVDSRQHVYVADYEIGGVQKFSVSGRFVARWRTRAQNPHDFTYAFKPSVDAAGNVYLADNHRNQVEEYSDQGTLIRAWSSGGPGVRRFIWPTSLAVDMKGDVYVVAPSEGGSTANAHILKFGSGPTHAEQVLARVFGSFDRVDALLDTLIDAPIRESWAAWLEQRPGGHCEIAERSSQVGTWAARCRQVAPLDSIESLGYVIGFDSEPRLAAVLWQVPPAVQSHADPEAIFNSLSDVLSRRLGFPTVAASGKGQVGREERVFPIPGAPLRLVLDVAQGTQGKAAVRLERRSDGLAVHESAPRDTSDLRAIEGQDYDPETVRADIMRALAHRPRLAGALSPTPTSVGQVQDVAAALRSVSDSSATDEERDLIYLSANSWLKSLPNQLDSLSVARLRQSLTRFGVRLWWDAEGQTMRYCGSLLPRLARRAGQNPWSDRAFVLLLEQGWDTTCTEQYEGASFANELFPPVLAHGEEFLARHRTSAVWPAVALRVALAHETVWSLSFTSTNDGYPDYRQGASEHLRRALELYRELVPHVRDPRFRVALDSKIRALEAGVDTHCRAYYVEWED